MNKSIWLSVPLILGSACSDGGSDRNLPPSFATAAILVTQDENTPVSAVDVSASDPNGSALTYSLSGEDAALFSVSDTGRLAMSLVPDFESPADADADNRYLLDIEAADPQGLTASASIELIVENVNEAPALQNAGQTLELIENTTTQIVSMLAVDPEDDAVSFSLGGPDAAHFTFSGNELMAATVLDFENPLDADGDNVYDLSVTVSDGDLSASDSLGVAVINVSGFSSASVAPSGQPLTYLVSWTLNDATPEGDQFDVAWAPLGDGNYQSLEVVPGTDTSVEVSVDLINVGNLGGDLRIEEQDAQSNSISVSQPIALANDLSTNELIGYFKTGVAQNEGLLGWSSALSEDGQTLVLGAMGDPSQATGIDGDESDTSSPFSGGVYVFRKTNDVWLRDAYLKASNAEQGDQFGYAVDVSDDGSIIVVGAPEEDSAARAVFSDEANNSNPDSGAIYVFYDDGQGWVQTRYLKSDTASSDRRYFGQAVAISGDGSTIAVGAPGELNGVGRAFTFQNFGSADFRWHPGVDVPIAGGDSRFGQSVSLNYDGSVLMVGAPNHDLVPDQGEGTVFVFGRNPQVNEGREVAYRVAPPRPEWLLTQQLSAPNPDAFDAFGTSLQLNAAGDRAVVSALFEDSAAGAALTDVDNSLSESGALYVADVDQNGVWQISARLKPADADFDDLWGHAVSLNASGTRIAVASIEDASGIAGLDADLTDTSQRQAGAVAVFELNNSAWTPLRTVKAAAPGEEDLFGMSIDFAEDGNRLLVGAPGEDGMTAGVNAGVIDDDSMEDPGAGYLY